VSSAGPINFSAHPTSRKIRAQGEREEFGGKTINFNDWLEQLRFVVLLNTEFPLASS
jgi:hypothetical protein